MTLRRRAACLWALPGLLGVLLAGPSAFGHSTEFILARVTARHGRVEVELTADYSANPMLAGRAEARTVLTKLLRVRAAGPAQDFASLAPWRFAERSQYDPTAPLPSDPATAAEPHQLLCATWTWECGSRQIAFEMPRDAGQTAILWTPPEIAGQPPRWVFLLPGETSPVIVVPPRIFPIWAAVSNGLTLFISAIAALAWAAKSRATRRSPPRDAASLG